MRYKKNKKKNRVQYTKTSIRMPTNQNDNTYKPKM